MKPAGRRGLLAPALLIALAAGLAALGIWQLERREWKHALIAAVDARVHAAPRPAPGPARWPAINAADNAYTHVRASGRYRPVAPVLVRAVTDEGAGYWVIAALDTGGFTMLVNRGFVPPERAAWARRADTLPTGDVTVTGLLRVTEPGGGFLRHNDPAADRWYSRDVAAIGAARHLPALAPYFIDADATPNPGGYPVGGLTVINFPDNHLVYALTWFVMAALSAGYAIMLLRGRMQPTA